MSHAQNKLTNRQNNARKCALFAEFFAGNLSGTWAVGYRVESNSTNVVDVRFLLDNERVLFVGTKAEAVAYFNHHYGAKA